MRGKYAGLMRPSQRAVRVPQMTDDQKRAQDRQARLLEASIINQVEVFTQVPTMKTDNAESAITNDGA
jgi:hypothetical protein